MKPAGAGAVMADKAPGEVWGDSPTAALYRKLEYFPTPPWAARAGGELIAKVDPGRWTCWEPACGEGHMAHGLADYFDYVRASDIHAHGWAGQNGPPLDFLSDAAEGLEPVDWIVTNPPYGLAADFVRTGLKRARRGVAVLARLAWFSSAGRYDLFFGDTPLDTWAPFFERPAMLLGRWVPDASTATDAAWFVFTQKAAKWQGQFRRTRPWDLGTMPIAPGTRARLTKPDDARLFGWKGPAPLFGDDGDA